MKYVLPGLGVLACVVMLAGLSGARSTSTLAEASSPLTAVAERERAATTDVGDAIRSATGLRLRVLESIIRRNIISTDTPYGYKIRSVDADSAAARAGLKKGDVLLEWNGKPIKSRKELAKWIEDAKGGEAITIKYARLKAERSALDRHPWAEHEGTISLEP